MQRTTLTACTNCVSTNSVELTAGVLPYVLLQHSFTAERNTISRNFTLGPGLSSCSYFYSCVRQGVHHTNFSVKTCFLVFHA